MMSQYPHSLLGALVQSFVCEISYYMHTPTHMSGVVLSYSAQFLALKQLSSLHLVWENSDNLANSQTFNS